MHRINPDIDIVAYIIDAILAVKPEDTFCKSVRIQYMERGGLSKKQLEGLQGKAARLPNINPGKLATLEAIIKKKHVTQRSEISIVNKQVEADEEAGNMIEGILEKFPQHKRVLYFKNIYSKQCILATNEKEELVKFYKILITDKKTQKI